MPSLDDLLVRKIILHNRFSTANQIQECLELQKKHPEKSLLELLLEKGYITKEQKRLIETLQKLSPQPVQEKKENKLFGKLVLMKQYAREGDIEECLKIQQELRKQGKYLRLGEILVQKAYLTKYQVEEVLKLQRQSFKNSLPELHCELCKAPFSVKEENQFWIFQCQNCQFLLKLPK